MPVTFSLLYVRTLKSHRDKSFLFLLLLLLLRLFSSFRLSDSLIRLFLCWTELSWAELSCVCAFTSSQFFGPCSNCFFSSLSGLIEILLAQLQFQTAGGDEGARREARAVPFRDAYSIIFSSLYLFASSLPDLCEPLSHSLNRQLWITQLVGPPALTHRCA